MLSVWTNQDGDLHNEPSFAGTSIREPTNLREPMMCFMVLRPCVPSWMHWTYWRLISIRTGGCPTALHGFLTANVRSPTLCFQKVNVPPSGSLPSSFTLLTLSARYAQSHSAFLAAAHSQHSGQCDRVLWYCRCCACLAPTPVVQLFAFLVGLFSVCPHLYFEWRLPTIHECLPM